MFNKEVIPSCDLGSVGLAIWVGFEYMDLHKDDLQIEIGTYGMERLKELKHELESKSDEMKNGLK